MEKTFIDSEAAVVKHIRFPLKADLWYAYKIIAAREGTTPTALLTAHVAEVVARGASARGAVDKDVGTPAASHEALSNLIAALDARVEKLEKRG